MVRAGEGLDGVGWEVEKRQQGKAAEVNWVPGSLIGSCHDPRHIVQSYHYFATSGVPILWSYWAKKYSPKIMRPSKGLDDKIHTPSNVGKTCLSTAPVASGQYLRRRQRPLILMSWLAGLELVTQATDAKMIRMEIFSSEDLTWLEFWN